MKRGAVNTRGCQVFTRIKSEFGEQYACLLPMHERSNAGLFFPLVPKHKNRNSGINQTWPSASL